MDHLPALEGQKPVYIRFQVDPSEIYRPDDFFKLPEIFGQGDGNIVENGLRPGTALPEASSFLQAWLFFSLLAQVLGIEVRAKDYYREEPGWGPRLTTKNLRPHLRGWSEREREFELERDGLNGNEKISRHISASLALNEARNFILRWCSDSVFELPPLVDSDKNKSQKQGSVAAAPMIDSEMILCFSILGETLDRVRPKIDFGNSPLRYWNLRSNEHRSWGTSKCLTLRMVDAGWCPRMIKRVQMTLPDVSTVYYALNCRPFGVAGTHEHCTQAECFAPTLAATGRPFHVNSYCRCERAQLDEKQLAKIIQRGNIPLAKYNALGHLEIEEYTVTQDYGQASHLSSFGAVSHAWSDGLGNSNSDGLPKCQISRLQDDFNDLIHAQGDPVPFWIDSLCIPGRYDLRKLAIRSMKEVYQRASAVLVLDSGLTTTSQQIQSLEANMRITLGAWTQRLWTLQEGVLSGNLYFKFKDGFLSTKQLQDRYKFAKHNPDNEFHHVMKAGWLFSPALNSLRDHKALAQDKAQKKKYELVEQDKVAHMWVAVQWRSTTKATDETICLATLMEMDPAPLLDIDANQLNAVEKRMEVFLDMLNYHHGIPPGMIFLPGKHLHTAGYGWAPVSWMTERIGKDANPLFPSQRAAAHLTKRGLLVEFPGLDLHIVNKAVLKRIFWVPVSSSQHKWYKIEAVIDDGENGEALWAQNICTTKTAIILSRFDPGEEAEIGLLVKLVNERKENVQIREHVQWIERTTRFVEVICRVWVCLETNHQIINDMKRDFRRNTQHMMWGERVDSDQKWCVDRNSADIGDQL